MNNKTGNLIVIYGINNIGKSTQAKMLAENIIIKMSKQAEYLKYPVYTLEPSGPLISDYLKQGNQYQLTGREFQLLQVLNRQQNEPNLKAKINAGAWVIAEDYIGTGIAWGMAQGISKEFLYKINSNLLSENLGILLDGQPFDEQIEKTNIHETDPALIQKAAAAFREIAPDFGWQIINANNSIEQVQEEILRVVKNKLSYLA